MESRLSFKQALTFLVSKVSKKALFAAGTWRFRARKEAAVKLFLSLVGLRKEALSLVGLKAEESRLPFKQALTFLVSWLGPW